MIRIKSTINDKEFVVTRGAYESLYKNKGFVIVKPDVLEQKTTVKEAVFVDNSSKEKEPEKDKFLEDTLISKDKEPFDSGFKKNTKSSRRK